MAIVLEVAVIMLVVAVPALLVVFLLTMERAETAWFNRGDEPVATPDGDRV